MRGRKERKGGIGFETVKSDKFRGIGLYLESLCRKKKYFKMKWSLNTVSEKSKEKVR